MFIRYIVLYVTFFVSKRYVDGRVIAGNLVTDKNWAFLARFCFFPTMGRAQYDIVNNDDPKNNTINLLLYRELGKWPSVYIWNRSCEYKQSIVPSNQIVQCSFEEPHVINGQFHCRRRQKITLLKPLCWFLVMADCSSRTGLNVTYRLTFSNDVPGGFWRKHFSADEFYFLPELIGVACAYVILLACSIYVSNILRHRRLNYMTFKIFLISEIFQMLGVFCEIFNLARIAFVDIDYPRIALAGFFLQSFAETLYNVVMLLLALGYTVAKSELTPKQLPLLLFFVFASEIYATIITLSYSRIFDPAVEVYFYESQTGYTLLGLKIFTWLVFALCCYSTSYETTTKYRFYVWLVSLGSAWYLVHPFTVIFVTPMFETWQRESISKGCSLLISLLGHATFLYVMRPSSVNDIFPFHIRRNQVMPANGVGENHDCEPRAHPNDSTSVSTISEFAMQSVTRSVR